MSIQAGWNSALATLSRYKGAKKILGAEGDKLRNSLSAQLKGYENIMNKVGNQTPEEREAAFQNLETENPDLFRRVNDMMNAGASGTSTSAAPATASAAPATTSAIDETQDYEATAANIGDFSEIPGQAVASRIASLAPEAVARQQAMHAAQVADSAPVNNMNGVREGLTRSMSSRQVLDSVHRMEIGGLD